MYSLVLAMTGDDRSDVIGDSRIWGVAGANDPAGRGDLGLSVVVVLGFILTR